MKQLVGPFLSGQLWMRLLPGLFFFAVPIGTASLVTATLAHADGGRVQWLEQSEVRQNRIYDSGRFSLNRNNTSGALALSNFVFNFENGDHRISTIGTTAESLQAEATFVDVNGDDPFLFQGAWIGSNDFLDGGSNFARSETEKTAVMTLRPAPEGYERVLRGFYLSTHPGQDMRVRQLMVWQTARDTYRVTLRNDLVPTGERIEVPRLNNSVRLDPTSAISRLMGWVIGLGTRHGDRVIERFGAFVYTTLIPRSMVLWSAESSGGNSRTVESGRLPSNREATLLRGFEFNFEGTLASRNLLQVGVRIPVQRSQQAIFFQDNNRDDTISWRLQYLGIHKPR